MPVDSLARRVCTEAAGSAFLLIAVVGSGIMGERLAQGNDAIALLANSAATAAALYVLILALAPLSGAHFNPAVTLVALAARELRAAGAAAYVAAQLAGAFAGVALAHAMFDLPPFTASQHARAGAGQWLGEAIATLGLLATVRLCAGQPLAALAAAVGAYIGGAYWFTSSTSFANPAVTLARAATDTFAGIRPADAPGFVAAQLAVAAAVALAVRRARG